MKRKLLIYPDQKLRQIAEPITDEFGSDWLKKLVQDMERIIEVNNGVGLAAVQIGVNKSVVIYKNRASVHGEMYALCNAKITARFGKVTSYSEGCLSVPGFRADIKRSKGVKIKAQTVDGKAIVIKERGFPAIILQHEIDHLGGIEFIDRVTDRKKVVDYLTELIKKDT